jgi:hypothetical protein
LGAGSTVDDGSNVVLDKTISFFPSISSRMSHRMKFSFVK